LESGDFIAALMGLRKSGDKDAALQNLDKGWFQTLGMLLLWVLERPGS
jgi:hypothetical protein